MANVLIDFWGKTRAKLFAICQIKYLPARQGRQHNGTESCELPRLVQWNRQRPRIIWSLVLSCCSGHSSLLLYPSFLLMDLVRIGISNPRYGADITDKGTASG